jgi:hypothetical protein
LSYDTALSVVPGRAQSVQQLVYGMNDLGSIFGRSKKLFLFSMALKPTLRCTQPYIQWEPEAVSPGVKAEGA